MSEATEASVPETTAKTVALEAEARELAGAQGQLERATPEGRLFEPPPMARRLERARRHLGAGPSGDAGLRASADWFLDNYYLIRRVARQVEEELPRGFARHLPQLAAGPERGRPRIDALARALVATRALRIDLAGLRRFIDAYQTVSPLTIAELWALPTVLRATVLGHLLRSLGRLGVPTHEGASPGRSRPDVTPDEDTLGLDPAVAVERAVRALRVLDVIDWKDFFERTNRVEALLRTDPAQVYRRMDFATCDAYRKVVERLAWDTGHTEEDVAGLALTLAREGTAGERSGLVDTYLVGEGRRVLEERLGYRPVGLERLRRLAVRWPTASYLVPLGALTAVPILAVLGRVARRPDAPPLAALAAAALVAVVPVSAMAAAIVHSAFARLLPPRTLPKLDFTKGLPEEARTLVVIPTLLGRAEDVDAMVRQIELHYLSNPDPRLQFALLTDDVDTRSARDEADERPLLASVAQAIEELNGRHGTGGQGPFHLLHRDSHWNESEGRFMGWERKRGKLEELNRLLRGDTATSYSRHVGDPAGLRDIRFVITLDSDTELPIQSAHRLVGLLAHPLNRAVFEPATGRVVAGYTIVQPRIETSPAGPRQTLFSRLFAGDVGLDIYTHASSELYQDLFGSGIYVGKGIYDVDAFMRSVAGRVPDNTLVSHDLFEGIHGRAALATDIVLFEGYPEVYATYALRMHRWVRGDWQLLPWLLARVPAAEGGRQGNPLVRIDRWKIVDNLRRSLTGPLLLALLVLGWVWLPGSAGLWTLGGGGLLLAPVAPSLRGRRRRSENLGRAALAVVFLAYEAAVVVDAIGRVFVRTTITRKNLLQWTSAAHAAFGIAARSPRAMSWQTMSASPALALAIGGLVAWLRPASLPAASPLLALWLLAPEVARWVSRPERRRDEPITADERHTLRLLARRTWRFFDVFVGPNDQWLPIDNHQEDPSEQTAHRTSPTNIGLTLLATLSAHDFGYIGPSELSLRLRRAFDSLARLPHYQGHLFNWYDTRNLQPLLPRYVSTVDSGNLAGCLLALAQGCREVASTPVLRAESWEGLRDSVDLLEEVVVSASIPAVASLRAVIARLQQATRDGSSDLAGSHAMLRVLDEGTLAELDRELLAFLGTGAQHHEADLLRALRMSIDRLHQQMRQMRRELDALLPWLALPDEARAHQLDLPGQLRLDEIPEAARRQQAALEAARRARHASGQPSPALDASAALLTAAFRSAEENATALVAELGALAARADEEAWGMDFKLLYDRERRLFHIGYNATSDQLDANYYDLLASEARLASYLAIVKRDVPESHWYALGRPLTRLPGGPALLSWGGTMFEYLMPNLLMRSQPGTLLARTASAVVDAQIDHGRRLDQPWGISESAYARVDGAQTYQYRSFGVPGLGFKRGLEDDRVVTPYASLLAVGIHPRAVVDNVAELREMGMLGTYGLFEALDLTPERALSRGVGERPYTVVRSYMAHHQGMLLIALGNVLNRRSMVDRFHADALVETGEALLNERSPDVAPDEWPLVQGAKAALTPEATAAPGPPGPW
ncbi:MAG: cellobiose phosphorylase, partial [Myxococcales bacterium]